MNRLAKLLRPNKNGSNPDLFEAEITTEEAKRKAFIEKTASRLLAAASRKQILSARQLHVGELQRKDSTISPATEATTVVPEEFFSLEAADRTQGTLRSLAAQFPKVKNAVTFTAGFPPPDAFPIKSMSIELWDGLTVSIPTELLSDGQQYNMALSGHPKLLKWAEDHVQRLHNPPKAANHHLLISNGGNHSLEMIFSMLMDRNEAFLVEEYAYPVVTESIALPKGYTAYAMPIDGQGIIPEELEKLLSDLDSQRDTKPFPKLLYTVPNGQNPTGCTITSARKRAVYRLCRRYNILIIEDDPYFYLQFPNGPEEKDLPGLKGLEGNQSYLSIDEDARVLRVDSFAKFFAPGLRLGFITASPGMIDKLTMIIQMHTVGPSSFGQVVCAAILEAWGDDGLDAHLRRVQGLYARKVAALEAAATRELKGLAEWTPVTCGMFLYMKILGVKDAADVWDHLLDEKVIIVPGRIMHIRAQETDFLSPHARLSFATPSIDQIDEGMARLGRALRKYQAEQAASRVA